MKFIQAKKDRIRQYQEKNGISMRDFVSLASQVHVTSQVKLSKEKHDAKGAQLRGEAPTTTAD